MSEGVWKDEDDDLVDSLPAIPHKQMRKSLDAFKTEVLDEIREMRIDIPVMINKELDHRTEKRNKKIIFVMQRILPPIAPSIGWLLEALK